MSVWDDERDGELEDLDGVDADWNGRIFKMFFHREYEGSTPHESSIENYSVKGTVKDEDVEGIKNDDKVTVNSEVYKFKGIVEKAAGYTTIILSKD